jgi:hypothetical protein
VLPSLSVTSFTSVGKPTIDKVLPTNFQVAGRVTTINKTATITAKVFPFLEPKDFEDDENILLYIYNYNIKKNKKKIILQIFLHK